VNYVQSLWTHGEEPQPKAVVTAVRHSGALPLSADDPVWQEVEGNWYPLVGQVIEGDRLFTPLVVGLNIQALHNGEDIVFRVVWDDRTESKPGEDEKAEGGTAYADAIALQFPSKKLAGERPYFLMGDSNHSTDLWYWRNDTNRIIKLQTSGYKTFNPDGVEETGEIEGQGVTDNGQYRVVMKRALHTKDAEQEVQFVVGEFLPISMTVWEGSNGETGGDRRAVTAWYNLYLEPEPSKAPMYLAMAGIAFGLVLMSTAVFVTKNGNGHAPHTAGQAHGAVTDETGDHS
jgi:DMSO reductase family type II enzyme heme b subunit